MRHKDRRNALVAGLAAAGATLGGLFGGLDSSFGGPIIGIGASAILAVTIALTRPSRRFWVGILPVVTLLTFAWVWALLTSQGALAAPALAPDLARPKILGLAASGAMFIVGGIVGYNRAIRHPAMAFLIGFAAIIATVGLVADGLGLTLSDTLWQPGQQGRFAGTFGNANVAATFCAATAILALAPLLNARPRLESSGVSRSLSGFAAAILIVACLATVSRMATVTLMIAVCTPLLVNFAGRRRVTLRIAVAAGTATIVFTILLLMYAGTLVSRFGTIGADGRLRAMIWEHYAAVAANSLWRGHGIGTFDIVKLRYLTNPEQAAALWPVNAAHNILLGMTIEAGLPFTILVVAAVIWIVARAALSVRRGSAASNIVSVAVAVGIILANAMVDIALDIPSMAALFWFLLGLLWGGSSNVSPRYRLS